MCSDKRFLTFDDGSLNGTHWTCYILKENISVCFDSFGVQPHKFLLRQLPKSILSHFFKKRDIHSKLYGSFCLYIFHMIERMNYYDAILKMYFG